jgi:hypothetical protein
VVANGQTAFVLVIAPDRSTAYAEFTPGLHLPNLSEQLAADAGLNLLRLDISLKRAIAAGIKDVYLPDDTHWATAGKQIAADSLVKYLQGGASAESAGP